MEDLRFSVKCVRSTTVLNNAWKCNADEKKAIADLISKLENYAVYGRVHSGIDVDTTDESGNEITSQINVEIENNHEYCRRFHVSVLRTKRFDRTFTWS